MPGSAFSRRRRWTGPPPPWWPAGEPWPPRGRPGHRGRAPLRRRVVIWSVLFFVLLAIAIAVIFHVRPGGWGPPEGEGPPWFVFPLFWLTFITIAVLTVRRLRRSIQPIDDVMEAASLVAEGDYSRRVTPRGPRDIRRLVDAFNTMTVRLQVNEEQRRHLFADTAHELRTPVAVIQGTVEGMLDGVYPTDEAHLTPLLDQTRIIARLLNDLQTIASAEVGVLVLHRSETDLAALIGDAVASFAPAAASNGTELGAEIGEMPDVWLDPVRIRQVLDNLIANALRYTREGGTVRIRASVDGSVVRVSVRDTGRGMTPEETARVFERFVKSADSGGSGLGLAIARSLVEAHGGEIRAESAPGAGTTMTFTIPLGTPE